MTKGILYSINVVFNLSCLIFMNNLQVNTAPAMPVQQINLGSIIHDLESPLMLTQYNLDQLYLKVSSTNNGDLVELLKPAIIGIKEISTMINSIKSKNKYAPYSVNQEVLNILDIFKNKCQDYDINLKYTSDCDKILYQHKVEFKSVVNNLVSNAIKAHLKSNKSAKYISITAKNYQKNRINIVIKDNAYGMPNIIQQDIKLNRLQLHSGLQIVYSNVLNIFQGSIRILAASKIGTEFDIIL